ncbi:uncharacterized protein JCM6883_005763 [Sporobolomyces salmoneus]|uniref:uncharacterized protein n=1 Tax=Sporobolomyces salmoneus TaxID=183962 RepID=UPI00316B95C9
MLAASYPTSSLPSPFQESRSFNRRPPPSLRPSSSRKSATASRPPKLLRVQSVTHNRPFTSRPRFSSYRSAPPQFIKLASFSDDNGFGDLLNPARSAFASTADDSNYGEFPTAQDDPWADTTSSSIVYPSATQQQSYYDEPTSPESPSQPLREDLAEDVSFHRENAPEPETPAPPPPSSFSYSQYDNDPYTPTSPLASTVPALPLSPSEQTPFGSPPTSPLVSSAFQSPPLPSALTGFTSAEPISPSRTANKPDLSALLGEEKPTLPSFSKPRRRERSEGVAGPLGSKIAVLPVGSVGRKPVGGALAALLGLEVEKEEEEERKPKPAVGKEKEKEEKLEVVEKQEKESTEKVESVEVPTTEEESTEDGTTEAPLPPTETSTTSLETDNNAVEVPLPPSPPAIDLETTEESQLSVSETPVLSRMPSETPSIASTTTENIPYESMVSPLDDKGEPAWPAKQQVDGLESQLASVQIDDEETASSSLSSTPTASFTSQTPNPPAASESVPAPTSNVDPSYSQYIFSDDTSNPQAVAGSTPSRGFRAFNGSGDEGGFGGGTDDGDSLRGAYSRSVEVGDAEDNDTETGTRANERAVDREETSRNQREGSAPLPPLPTAATIQGSPRSKDLGGSLGPSFIITVGDPQTVGKNPASQHTVFTVRTRTTSSAFRKSDFSVLRRYSHFVWLYDALMQNNPGVIVPGMPEKHVMGRFGTDFIENRRLGLQAALTKIVAHPMLVGDPDLRLFLESDTFHIDIKQRKIDTSHESKGFLANLSSSISGPKFVEFDEYFENRRHALDTFETQLRSLLTSLSVAAKARSVLQASFADLQASFLALAESDLSTQLRKLFNEAASLQKRLYDLSEAQAVSDEQIGGLVSVAESYARMCASARGVFGARIKAYHTWQTADSRLRKAQAEHEKGKRSGRTHSELLPDSVAMLADAERKMLDARHDFEDVSKLTKAEMARFDKEKVDDFKKALEEYTDSLALRQREVVSGWQHYYDLLFRTAEANESSQAAVPSDS